MLSRSADHGRKLPALSTATPHGAHDRMSSCRVFHLDTTFRDQLAQTKPLFVGSMLGRYRISCVYIAQITSYAEFCCPIVANRESQLLRRAVTNSHGGHHDKRIAGAARLHGLGA
jgi:hypothetical protein